VVIQLLNEATKSVPATQVLQVINMRPDLTLPTLKCGGSPRARRFGATSPLPEDSILGWVSGPLPLPQTGLGVMSILNAPTRSALNTLSSLMHLNSPRLILSPHPSPWIGHLDEVYAFRSCF
jgi:hypothetical protein